jgi:hypothetical protein
VKLLLPPHFPFLDYRVHTPHYALSIWVHFARVEELGVTWAEHTHLERIAESKSRLVDRWPSPLYNSSTAVSMAMGRPHRWALQDGVFDGWSRRHGPITAYINGRSNGNFFFNLFQPTWRISNIPSPVPVCSFFKFRLSRRPVSISAAHSCDTSERGDSSIRFGLAPRSCDTLCALLRTNTLSKLQARQWERVDWFWLVCACCDGYGLKPATYYCESTRLRRHRPSVNCHTHTSVRV